MTSEELIAAVGNLSDPEFALWLAQERPHLTRDSVNTVRLYAEEIGNGVRLKAALGILDRAEQLATALADPLATALVWRGRANVWQYNEHFTESIAAAERAAAIYQEHGTPFDVAVARTVQVASLGWLERFDEAIKLAQWIRPHFEAAAFTFGQARLTHALANVYVTAWRLEEALIEYQQAHDFFVQLALAEDTAWVLHNLGLVYHRLDQPEQAQHYYALARQAFPTDGDREGPIKLEFNMAENFLRQAQYEQALTHLAQARTLLKELPTSLDVGYVDLFEAKARRALHELASAEELLQHALAHFQGLERHIEAAIVLVELGHLAVGDRTPDRLAQSLTYLEEAESSLQHLVIPLFLAWIQLEQGELLWQLGRPTEAAARAAGAGAIFTQFALPLRRAQADVLLADCCQQTDPEQARERYQAALAATQEAAPTIAIRCWRGLGQLAQAVGDYSMAEALLGLAVQKLQDLRRALRSHTHQAGFLEDKQGILELLLAAIHAQPDPQTKVFTWLEQLKANALADLLVDQPLDSQIDEDLRILLIEREGLAGKLDQHVAALQAGGTLAQAPQRGPAMAAHDAYQQQEMAAIRRQLQLVDEQIDRRRDPGLLWRTGAIEIAPQAMHDLLDDPTVLISYYTVQGELYALTATNQVGDIQLHALGVSLAEVEEQWWRSRRFILRPNGKIADLNSRLSELWKKLIAPLETRLASKERLLILPHRSLFHLPFTALYDPVNRCYLLERWLVQYAPSATIYHWCRQQPPGQAAPLLIGYPGEPGQADYLPNVEQEIQTLQALFPQADLCYGNDITSQRVLQEMPGRQFVHFACHAWFDHMAPLESYIALPNRPFLRASDLYRHHGRLNGATVVLGACETALGRPSGNDILGLTSAFFYAGAVGIIASLWKVDDGATRELMIAFYRRIQTGADTATALRSAQQQLLHQSSYTHPYFWAAFGISGDSRVLQ